MKTITLTANNTTAIVDLFAVTGNVRVNQIYGVVTETLGASVTLCGLIADNGSVSTALSTAAENLSSFPPNSLITRRQGASNDLASASAAACAQLTVSAATAKNLCLSFATDTEDGVTTYIQFTYTTTDAPTTGAMTWYCLWQPLTDGSFIDPV